MTAPQYQHQNRIQCAGSCALDRDLLIPIESTLATSSCTTRGNAAINSVSGCETAHSLSDACVSTIIRNYSTFIGRCRSAPGLFLFNVINVMRHGNPSLASMGLINVGNKN